MHTISILTKSITVEPKHLTPEIKKHVINELKKKYEKTCCEKSGLIISIEDLVSMDNLINKDSIHITFMATFKAVTVKPEKGMKFSFVPTLILSKGVFGKMYENINFFIPETALSLSAYTFDAATNSFKADNKEDITCVKNVDVIIDQLKCDTLKYNCIVYLEQ
jgi:DNA-directed RNA polymerase subunit E'/Rpb7